MFLVLSVVLGSAVPLLLFLGYTFTVLGNVASLIPNLSDLPSNLDAVEVLQSQTNSPLLSLAVRGFSTTAILTSATGFIYGLEDALAETSVIPKQTIPALIAVPPVLIGATLGSDAFLQALNFASLYGVTVLFLFLPPLLAGRVRYSSEPLRTLPLVPGGKIGLGYVWKR